MGVFFPILIALVMSDNEDIVDTDDDSCDETGSDSYDTFSATDSDEMKDTPIQEVPLQPSTLENSLEEKNREIATTLKAITVSSLTPTTQKKIKEKPEAEAESQPQPTEAGKSSVPEWVKRATQARANRIQAEMSGTVTIPVEEKLEPEWIEKAKQAQISRDLRGLERFVNRKAPALPPEPEWLSKAHKRRDLTKLLATPEKVHVSNVETPLWVQSSAAQKILNSFLQDDKGVIPEWMQKGVEMTTTQKNILLEQLEKLKEILEAERKLTAERETLLASTTETLQSAEVKLEESVASYRELRENRKDKEKVQGVINSSNEIFTKNQKFMANAKEKFGLSEHVRVLVKAQEEKEEKILIKKENARKARAEEREKKRAARKGKSKKSKKAAVTLDSSKDEIKQNVLEKVVLDEENSVGKKKRRRKGDKTDKSKRTKKGDR